MQASLRGESLMEKETVERLVSPVNAKIKPEDYSNYLGTGMLYQRSVACSQSLKLLSVMAAIRLDGKPDKIQSILSSSLMDRDLALLASQDRSMYPLASSSWEEVSPKDLLITPVQCKALWRRFKSETEYAVTQAISAQEAYKQSNNWLPPPWAIVAMAILGFNEFMLLLKNPLYVLVLFVGYLLSKAIWVNMDIQGEFRHGALAGIISISSKVLPTIMNLLRKLAEEAQGNQNQQAPRPESLASQSFRSQTQATPMSNVVAESSVSSNISSTDDGVEHSSPNLTYRRNTKIPEADFSS